MGALWPQLRGGRGDSAGREILATSNSVKTMKQDHEAWSAGGKASPCRARTTAAFSVTCGRVKVRLDSPDRASSTAADYPPTNQRDQPTGPVPAGVADPVGGDGGEHGERHGRGQYHQRQQARRAWVVGVEVDQLGGRDAVLACSVDRVVCISALAAVHVVSGTTIEGAMIVPVRCGLGERTSLRPRLRCGSPGARVWGEAGNR